MNYLEMFIVVLAVILFTTAALVHHRSTMAATENLANATYRIQATQLAHEVLDQIDARLLHEKKNYFNNDLVNDYHERDYSWDLEHFGATFKGQTKAAKCDQHGDTGSPDNYHVLVEVEVWGPDGLKAPVKFSRVYTSWKL